MRAKYCFRIQKVRIGLTRQFQLRVGMPGEAPIEFIPVHRSAFAQRLPLLQEGHAEESDAHLELTGLLDWLETRHG